MNRILLVQQNWLGDALFATPAIRAVRKKFPDAYIACLAPARALAALKNNPYINELIECPDRVSVFSGAFWKLVFLLRSQKFDTAVFFHRSSTRVRLAKFAGIPNRIGFVSPARKAPLTRAVEAPAAKLHKIDYFLYLIQSAGIASDGRLMDFSPDPKAAAELDKIFAENGIRQDEPYAVVHAGGNWNLKRWPSEYFSQWIYYFFEKYRWKVIVCGTLGEGEMVQKIISKFSSGQAVSLCGKTSLDVLALLLKNAKLLLSNDSGPIHLAATQKTRIIGLFGPTSVLETGPVSDAPLKILQKNVGCEIPCYYESCNYRVCMDFLLPDEVFMETQKILEAP